MKKNKNHIVWFIQWILENLIKEDVKYSVSEAFEDQFLFNVKNKGKFKSYILYFFCIFSFLISYFATQINWRLSMIKNYIKIAIRNILNKKSYSLLNIIGLSFGMACCILILLFIQDELSYDKFHEKAERIYRITTSTNRDNVPTNANGIFATGPALKRDFPEVLDFVRINSTGQGTKDFVKHGDKRFYEERLFYTDSSFFTIFSFHLTQGNPLTALQAPNTIVITEEMALKYFGDENPLGKILFVEPYGEKESVEFTITGVSENTPKNSHFHYDFLASFSTLNGNLNSFSGMEQVWTYLLIAENASEEELESKLLDFLKRNWREDPWYTNQLQPFLDIRLKSHLKSEIEPNGNITYIYIFSVIGIFILFIACINFMNLATARSIKRSKEVGLRKVAGAQRTQLIGQFLGESILLSIIGGIFAILLAFVFLPLFNNLADKEVQLNFFKNHLLGLGSLIIILFFGIISGSYPALFLSSFKPSNVLKGSKMPNQSIDMIRKGLVIFQFAVSVSMITATGIALNQMNYIKTKSLGYDSDHILVLPLNEVAKQNYKAIQNELVSHPNINNTTTSSLVPTKGSSHNTFKLEGVEEDLSIAIYRIDKDFSDTYNIKLLAGDNIINDITIETGGDFLISESTISQAGWKDPTEALGKVVRWRDYNGVIKGVVNDLHLYSFRHAIYEMIFCITPIQYHNYLSIRLAPGDFTAILNYIKSVWEKLVPGYPFDYFFLDESFERMHRSDQKLCDVFTYFSFLAILIACIGLFGLAAFTAEQKTKEIGIRKVLGASVPEILIILIRKFTWLILLSNIVAWPATYYFMNRWLQGFFYNSGIKFSLFLSATGFTFLLVLLTVSYQSIKAAFTNPVESLKNE